MKIGIIGAMVEEITPLLENLEYRVEEFANNKFYFANYKNHELIIVYSKIGKVNSTLSATLLIEKYGAENIIFTGVAGGINESLRIGDMIVAEKLVQHDVDITAFGHPFGFIPESGDFINTDKKLTDLAIKAIKSKNKSVISGVIATGDQFIANNEKKNWIRETFSADALEMEGASVAYVCHVLNTPFCVLRAISDVADMDAGFSFDKFLETSAKESASIVLEMIDYI